MADITLQEIRLRRSSDPAYRPGMSGSEALGDGEPFVNFADGVLCIGRVGGGFIETALEFEDAWSSFVPVVSSGAGAINSSTALFHYIKRGKSVTFRMSVSILSNGTGSGYIAVTLPFQPVVDAATPCILAGRNPMTGFMLQCVVGETPNTVKIYKYDNAYPISGDLQVMFVTGTYEAA